MTRLITEESLTLPLLMWPWRVRTPIEHFTDVIEDEEDGDEENEDDKDDDVS